jgi:hypothetical protein
LAANLEAFGNGPPDADDEDPTTTTTAAPPPPTKTTAAPPPPPSPDADTCGVSYKVVLDHFDVYGKNFDPTKFANGSGLKKQIQGR